MGREEIGGAEKAKRRWVGQFQSEGNQTNRWELEVLGEKISEKIVKNCQKKIKNKTINGCSFHTHLNIVCRIYKISNIWY